MNLLRKSRSSRGWQGNDESCRAARACARGRAAPAPRRSRTRRAAGHRDARRVDERARLDAPLVCRSAHRRFHMWLVEGHRRRAARRRSAPTCAARAGDVQVLLDRLRLRTRPYPTRNGRACSTKSVSRFARGRSSSSSREQPGVVRADAAGHRPALDEQRHARPRRAPRAAAARCTARSSSRASRC